MVFLQQAWLTNITKRSNAKLICIPFLIQHEVIQEVQALPEPLDELTYINIAISKYEGEPDH